VVIGLYGIVLGCLLVVLGKFWAGSGWFWGGSGSVLVWFWAGSWWFCVILGCPGRFLGAPGVVQGFGFGLVPGGSGVFLSVVCGPEIVLDASGVVLGCSGVNLGWSCVVLGWSWGGSWWCCVVRCGLISVCKALSIFIRPYIAL
jgi:hypothetical protein